MKKSPALQVEEIPGDTFPDLESAQRAALPLVSANLQAVIRDLLERGELVNDNGKIIPNRRKAPRTTSRYDRNT